MESGYYRPGDALPRSAKRENAITEVLNQYGPTGTKTAITGGLPPGCVYVWNTSNIEIPKDAFYTMREKTEEETNGPENVLVLDWVDPQLGPIWGFVNQSIKPQGVGVAQIYGDRIVSVSDQYDGVNCIFANTGGETLLVDFSWQTPAPWVFDAFMQNQNAVIRVETFKQRKNSTVLYGDRNIYFGGAAYPRTSTQYMRVMEFFGDRGILFPVTDGFLSLLHNRIVGDWHFELIPNLDKAINPFSLERIFPFDAWLNYGDPYEPYYCTFGVQVSQADYFPLITEEDALNRLLFFCNIQCQRSYYTFDKSDSNFTKHTFTPTASIATPLSNIKRLGFYINITPDGSVVFEERPRDSILNGYFCLGFISLMRNSFYEYIPQPTIVEVK